MLLLSSCGSIKGYIVEKYRENGYFKDKYPESDDLLLKKNVLVVGNINIFFEGRKITEYCSFSVFENSEMYDDLRMNLLQESGLLRIPLRTNQYQLAGFTCLSSSLNPYIDISFTLHDESFDGKVLNLGNREITIYRKFIDYRCKSKKIDTFKYNSKVIESESTVDFCSDEYL